MARRLSLDVGLWEEGMASIRDLSELSTTITSAAAVLVVAETAFSLL